MASLARYDESTIAGTSKNRSIQYPDKVYLLSRLDSSGRKTDDVHTVTYGQMDAVIRDLCKGLDALGVEALDRVAVYGPNTPRWIFSVFAAISIRGTFVPIYPNSKTEDVWWNLYDSAAKVVFCHGKEHLGRILEVKDRLENLKWIVVMDPDVPIEAPNVISFDDVVKKGRSHSVTDEQMDKRLREVQEGDIAAIIYTSGTTGRPKGVMLTHKNFVAQRVISDSFDFSPNDVWFGHLPMCHSFGFSSDLLNSGFQGGQLFVADSVKIEELRDNLKRCRPTVMSSVPRLWEKMFVQINGLVARRPPAVQKIFQHAMSVGRETYLREIEGKPIPLGLGMKHKVATRILNKVKKEAGMDRLRITHTGGGPINAELITFFGSIGINLYQGFGLTETSPVTHTCTPKAHKLGWVGKPIPGTECKIDVDGELLIRGPQVMKGYFNNPEATKQTFTDDGFFRTGDIGEIDSEGYLRITDRKKELIVTSGGKNIAPQPIENAFNTDPYIEQVCVIGDNRNYLVALVIPNFESLGRWAKEQGIQAASHEDLVKDPKVLKLIQASMDRINGTLAKYETIKKFSLLPHEFSEQGGELTPTLKKKRRIIDQKYKDIIQGLYA